MVNCLVNGSLVIGQDIDEDEVEGLFLEFLVERGA